MQICHLMPLTLYYYAIEGGRVGCIRAALLHAGVEFEDKMLNFQEYSQMKAAGTAPAGMPCLEIDGKQMTQSLAISRFVGKKSDLYPKDDVQALVVDEV